MAGKRRTVLPIVLLIVATFIVLGRVCAGNFVQWDDPDMVEQNPGLNPPSMEHVGEFWREPCLGLYTPLAYTAWSGVSEVARSDSTGELDPIPFHLLNLLLHGTAVVFVFLILRELIDSPWTAWGGAMVFALHPLQVEPVGWVAGMNNVLCGALGLAAVWRYVVYAKMRGQEGRSSGAQWHFLIACALFAAALLSKPTAVVLPVVVGIVDLWILRRQIRAVVGPVVIWLALAAPIAIKARLAQPAGGITAPPLWGRAAVAVDALEFYLRKVMMPVHLAIDYGRTPRWLLAHPGQAWVGIASVVLVVGAILVARSVRGLAAGFVVMIAGLLPVLGLTPFDFQHYSTVADRYMYLPMLGVALMAAAIFAQGPRIVSWTIAGIVLAALGVLSFNQAGIWRNTQTLADHELRLNDQSATGHKILGAWLARQGHDNLAEPQYRAAISVLEKEPDADGAVWFDYGNLLLRERKLVEAIEQYRQAVPRLKPEPRAAAYNNMGVALVQSGDETSALEAFHAALRLRPDYPEAQQNLRKLGE